MSRITPKGESISLTCALRACERAGADPKKVAEGATCPGIGQAFRMALEKHFGLWKPRWKLDQ